MKEDFIEYCKEERRRFVNKFIQINPKPRERVMAEDMLIAYDNLLNEYIKLKKETEL